MNRRSKTIEQRNRAIYAAFTALIRNDTPVMLVYAYCAKYHDLGEESIRKIVAQQTWK